MALQPCRASLARGREALCALATPHLRLRSFATDTTPDSLDKTPESFKIPELGGTGAPRRTTPRWSRTPPEMKAAVQMDFAKSARNKVWTVNNSPERLDEMYDRLLGPGGRDMLPEELKWLAVTHKSFDQGRRGFNDRLALMGRLTLVMEATKDIVSKAPMEGTRVADEFERQPFEHPQLLPVDNLIVKGPRDMVGKDELCLVATRAGLLDVLRWKPRLPRKLEASGVEVVLSGAVLAIIGAITLQHGSVVASEVVRNVILSRLRKD